MITKSTQYAVCLGLAGSFAIAIAPAVRADIKVTGGSASGQAAFFVPTPGGPLGKVELFDVGISKLTLQTPNGNTSTAIFTPTGASFNAQSNSGPASGDTGTLKGTLAGVAFAGGTPIPFLNRQTILNFTLNSFSSNLGEVPGTLVSPQTAGNAPLVFLPNLSATLTTGSSFQATLGKLQLGDFKADLKDGLIALDSRLTFRDSGSPTVIPVALVRSLEFNFEGKSVLGYNLTSSSNQISFAGPTTNFDIKGDDSGGGGKFEFKGTLGTVDIQLSSNSSQVSLDNTKPLDYKIDGKSNGAIFFSGNQLALNGFQGNTTYQFNQDNQVKLQGSSQGAVNFYAVAGVSNFRRDQKFTDAELTTSSLGSNAIAICSICNSPQLINNSSLLIGSTLVTVGNPIIVNIDNSSSGLTGGSSTVTGGSSTVTGGSSTVTGGSSTATGGSSTATGGSSTATGGSSTATGGSTSTSSSGNTINISLFGLGGASTSSTAVTQYQILASSNIRFVTKIDKKDQDGGGRIRVRLVNRKGDRFYLVTSDSSGSSTSNSASGQTSSSSSASNTSTTAPTNTGDSSASNTSTTAQTNTGGSSASNTSTTAQTNTGGSSASNTSSSSDQAAYQLVGPTSRCFPGLVGLRQLPPQEAAKLSADNDDDKKDEGRNTRKVSANQGIGNGPEGADPGRSRPHGSSNDEGGRSPGGRSDR